MLFLYEPYTGQRGRAVLERAVDGLGLSARAYHRVLRIARTIADLAEADRPSAEQVAEALSLRRAALESQPRPT